MTSARHRGGHALASSPRRTVPAVGVMLAGLLVLGVVAVSVLGVRAVADGRVASGATTFTGVVSEFADDGALMCVRREGSSDAPFCDVYYVRPGTPAIEVGDRVQVQTIATRGEDGSPMSGMLVAPLP